MTRGGAAYFASCSAVVVASLVYVAPAFTSIPVFWYHPLARSWALEAEPSGFAIDWYGRTAWAVLAAAVAFAITRAIARRIPDASPRTYRVWAAWVGMMSVLAITVYTYQLAYRHVDPEATPPSFDRR
jgi:hypothetical protein